jgi:hypothetical protein
MRFLCFFAAVLSSATRETPDPFGQQCDAFGVDYV